MTEFELIGQLSKLLPLGEGVVTGVGDDCAVLDLGHPDNYFLFKTDAVVEGIHFQRKSPPDKVGYKALARCLSDIAAMAGTPLHALVTLGLPNDYDANYVTAIYTGMRDLAARFNVSIVGGETTTNPERLLINIALIGSVPRGQQVLRSGAFAGDALFVTGELGGSLEGRHLEFQPRLAEAIWLREHFEIHSMIDLSDGLAGDLKHLLKTGGIGAELLESSVPISRAAKARFREGKSSKPALLAALTDGEDFELLFTVASKDAVPMLDGFRGAFPDVKLSCVGRITSTPGLGISSANGTRDLVAEGYSHFSNN